MQPWLTQFNFSDDKLTDIAIFYSDNSFCLRTMFEEQHQGGKGSKSAAKSSVLEVGSHDYR